MMKKTLSLFWAFFKIGAFTFGGGYAMIALLENEFVERKKWITKNEFLDMVAIAESTPGPVAVNSATYIGYKTAGFKGAAGGADIFLDCFMLLIQDYACTPRLSQILCKVYTRPPR